MQIQFWDDVSLIRDKAPTFFIPSINDVLIIDEVVYVVGGRIVDYDTELIKIKLVPFQVFKARKNVKKK